MSETGKFKRVIDIPKKTEETEDTETETQVQPVITESVKQCPVCGGTEEWYYDEEHEAYYCGKCRKIFLKD